MGPARRPPRATPPHGAPPSNAARRAASRVATTITTASGLPSRRGGSSGGGHPGERTAEASALCRGGPDTSWRPSSSGRGQEASAAVAAGTTSATSVQAGCADFGSWPVGPGALELDALLGGRPLGISWGPPTVIPAPSTGPATRPAIRPCGGRQPRAAPDDEAGSTRCVVGAQDGTRSHPCGSRCLGVSCIVGIAQPDRAPVRHRRQWVRPTDAPLWPHELDDGTSTPHRRRGRPARGSPCARQHDQLGRRRSRSSKSGKLGTGRPRRFGALGGGRVVVAGPPVRPETTGPNAHPGAAGRRTRAGRPRSAHRDRDPLARPDLTSRLFRATTGRPLW